MPASKSILPLFWYTLRRALAYALLLGIVFLLSAIAIYKVMIQGRPPHSLFRLVPPQNFFAAYVVAGVLSGYAAGIASALAARPKDLAQALAPFLAPTIRRMLDQQSVSDAEEGGGYCEKLAVEASRRIAKEDLTHEKILETVGVVLHERIAGLKKVNVILGAALLLSPVVLLLVFR